MTFATDDSQFGVTLTPRPGRGRWRHSFFAFQLIVSGQVIGDAEPCLPHSAMRQLRQPAEFGVDQLPDVLRDPSHALSLLLTVEELHDRAVLSGPESLDGWVHLPVPAGAKGRRARPKFMTVKNSPAPSWCP